MCNASTANGSGTRSAPRISAEYAQKSIYLFFTTSSGFWQAQNTANFMSKHCQFYRTVRNPAGPGAHLSLVSCHSSLTYSALTYSALSPFGAKNNEARYYACFTQSSDTSSMYLQCTIFCEGCQRWSFSTFAPSQVESPWNWRSPDREGPVPRA